MCYIDLINNFWREDEQWGFSCNETRLYFYLLHLANRLFWEKEWIEQSNERIMANVGISEGALRTAREKLKEASLIDFIIGGRGYRVKSRYHILLPKPNTNRQPKSTPSSKPLYNNTKTKNNNSNERFSKREFVASGSDFDE